MEKFNPVSNTGYMTEGELTRFRKIRAAYICGDLEGLGQLVTVQEESATSTNMLPSDKK